MAKKKSDEKTKRSNKSEKNDDRGIIARLRDETIQGVLAVISFTLAIIVSLAVWGKAGYLGQWLFNIDSFSLYTLLGVGYYLLPLIFIAFGVSSLISLHRKFDSLKLLGFGGFLLFSLGIIHILSTDNGGLFGTWIAYPFVALLDTSASLIILSAFVIVSILIAFNEELDLKSLFSKKEEGEEDVKPLKLNLGNDPEEDTKKKKYESEEEEEKPKEEKKSAIKVALGMSNGEEDAKDFIKSPNTARMVRAYVPPPLSLLERDKGKPVVGDVKANANIIKRTLANFGIDVEMDEVSIGPSVTRYALKPAEGVKLSKIITLQNDLALALAAHPLRIEAPIPGKSLVGIEIPNTTKTTVGLGTLFSADEFQTSDKPLLTALGKGISGKSHFANAAKMPHLLIAGATGSGKSVTIHALIVSLLYRNSPEMLKFIMIDPKRVELTLYNKIPHLLTPVITDAKKAILSLKWAAKEMDRRYDVLQAHGVRDIDSYHKSIYEPSLKKVDVKKNGKDEEESMGPEPLPYIVIVIDELADIMQAYPRELEAGIVRLAQMSRAVGIHLMLSTQRPSVNVITGLIKANVPARLALQVASQVDSRTILDTVGAEKLLGAGDMLYLSGEMNKPTRIQCAYISESEVKKVVKYLADSYQDELTDTLNLTENSVKSPDSIFSSTLDDGADEDDMYEEARRTVTEAGKASTSYIQRKLRVGYSRAARLMDILEERGVIGPADGSKPRSVLGIDTDTESLEEIDTDNSE